MTRAAAVIAPVWLFTQIAITASDIQPDETVVFFSTAARHDESAGRWIVPIHAWVYEPEESQRRKSALATLLKSGFNLEPTPETRANFDRRVDLFLGDNERGKRLQIRIAGELYDLPSSRADGHIRTELRVPEQAVARHGLAYRAILAEGDDRALTGQAYPQERNGITVISDIDDTVKITEVRDRNKLLDNTFVRDFRAVPGMAAKYAEWSDAGAAIHFVSSSPWQLYEPLVEFLERADFPPAVLHLKKVRFKDSTLFDLFRPGTETKPRQIEPILKQFPERRFVLVGDSGEQDPEVYAALLRRFPRRIAKVYIRNVTEETPNADRFRRLFGDLPRERWSLFTDPTALELPGPPP